MHLRFREKSVSETSANNQFLILAPTDHCSWESSTEHTIIGEVDMGDAMICWCENEELIVSGSL